VEIDLKYLLGIIAGIISFIAYIIYVYSITKGESKPNRITWWIWTFMGLVLAISYYFSGAKNTIWSPIVEFIGPLLVSLLSIKYGEGGIQNKTDIFCLCGGVFSIILWIIFNSPIIALVINLFIDLFALTPTIKKSFIRPEGENFWAWFGTGIGDTINLFAIEKFTFGISIYPIYMLFADIIIIGILLSRKIKRCKINLNLLNSSNSLK